MGWLLMRSFRSASLEKSDYAWLSWLSASSYGILLEALQMMLPWRSADWRDISVNALGAAAGVALARYVHAVPKR